MTSIGDSNNKFMLIRECIHAVFEDPFTEFTELTGKLETLMKLWKQGHCLHKLGEKAILEALNRMTLGTTLELTQEL